MRHKSALVIGLAASLLAGGSALAQGQHMQGQHDTSEWHDKSSHYEEGMMPMGRHHGKMDARQGMMAMHHDMMGMHHGMMQRDHVQMGRAFHDHLDIDGDGRVTPTEARSWLGDSLDQYDENGDGTLDIDEFEVLHSRLIRETMVDRFQHLDADGDGRVTRKEMTAPAERMERMHKMRQMYRKRMRGMEDDMMPDSE